MAYDIWLEVRFQQGRYQQIHVYSCDDCDEYSLLRERIPRVAHEGNVFENLRGLTLMCDPSVFGAESSMEFRKLFGQGAFPALVADAYHNRCAITGECTMPVLQAAHIRPNSQDGPHEVTNGLFLRSDMHTLFDGGYLKHA